MTKTILLVDDDPDLVEMLRRKLEAEGYAVVMALDGKEALMKAEASQPDLVLLDLMMPVMDGFATLQELRRMPKTHATPIVILTGKGDRKSIFQAELLGANGFLVKPCDWTDMANMVRKHLGE